MIQLESNKGFQLGKESSGWLSATTRRFIIIVILLVRWLLFVSIDLIDLCLVVDLEIIHDSLPTKWTQINACKAFGAHTSVLAG